MINFIHYHGGQFGDLICKLLNSNEILEEKFKKKNFDHNDIKHLKPGFYPTHKFLEFNYENKYQHYFIDIKNVDIIPYTGKRFFVSNNITWEDVYDFLPNEYKKIIDTVGIQNKQDATIKAYTNMLMKKKMMLWCINQNWYPINIYKMDFDSIWKNVIKINPTCSKEIAIKIYDKWKIRELSMFPNCENILF